MDPMKIFLPVAMPKRFAGAPEAPAFCNVGVCFIVFMLSILMEWPYPVMWIGVMIAVHVGLVAWYNSEPHLSTLMNTMPLSRRRSPAIGPRRAQEFHP